MSYLHTTCELVDVKSSQLPFSIHVQLNQYEADTVLSGYPY